MNVEPLNPGSINIQHFSMEKEGKNMKEKRNVHLKVQELCDCYATNDPLKEMSTLKIEADKETVSLKFPE